MADVGSGYTIEGESVGVADDFDAMLAKAVAKGRQETATEQPGATYARAVRAVTATGDEIRAAVAKPDELASGVAAGLTVRDPVAEREAREAGEASQSSQHKSVVLARFVGQQAARADAAESELALRSFNDRLFEAESRSDVIGALVELRQLAPTAYEDALDGIPDLEALFGVEDAYLFEDAETDEEANAIARAALSGEVAWKLDRDKADAEAFVNEASAQLAQRAAITDRQERVRAWQKENKLSKDDATQRYLIAREIGLDAGFDLERLSGERFDDLLRGAAAALDEMNSAEREREFKQRLVDAPTTKVGDGYETQNAMGDWVRSNAVRIETRPVSPQAIERRATPRESAAQIRAALLGGEALEVSRADDGSLDFGGDRPIQAAYEHATRARERAAEEQRQRVAESRP